MIPSIFAELGIAMTLLVAACGVTWFASEAHYRSQLAEFEGQVRGAAEAQKIAVAKQKAADDAVSQEISNEAQDQIGSMSTVLGDLSMRLFLAANSRTVTVRPAAPSTAVACVKPDRPATAAGDRPVPKPQGPVAAAEPETAAIPPDILDGVLTVGIDALKAELLYREFLRKTGQVPNGKPSN